MPYLLCPVQPSLFSREQVTGVCIIHGIEAWEARMDLLSSLFGGLCSLLGESLGRLVLRFLTRGRYPGKSAYWDGVCEIIGLLTTIICITAIIGTLLLVYALTR